MPSSRIADQVGRVLGGRYRLLAPVGTGASAHVFVADDVVLRRRVAVKVLQHGLADDEGFLRRFRAEARSAAGLNHPNIMRVFDWGEDDDGPFLVLEYLGGGSLRDLLDRGNRLSPAQAAIVGLEAARALDYAHRRGIVHRDIKPANLLFDDEGRLCIADFGLARALAEAAATEPQGALLGTVRYASPEQARGSSIDGRGDVYALALVVIEAVTGHVPFSADTTIATLMGRTESPIPVPDELGPLAPALLAAGTVDPAARADAAAFASALAGVAAELPPPERPPLAGTAPLDASRTAQADPTQMPPVRPRLFDREAGGAADEWPDAEEILPMPLSGGRRHRLLRRRHGLGRRRRRWPLVTLATVIAVIAAGAATALATGAFVPSHPVPQLRDKTVAQAEALVAVDKFKVVVQRRQFDEKVAKDHIVSTSPAANAKLKEHHTLNVTLSQGPAPRTVPDLTGDEAGAVAKLTQAGLGVTFERPYDENVPKGQVMAWDPKTGSQLPKGGTVKLTVSNGPAPRPIADWRGHTFDEVNARLQGQQLVVKRVDVFDDTIPVGSVVSTNPPAGGQAAKGSTVTVNVSKGPDLVAVPDVRGFKLADARAALQQAGFTITVYGPNNARTVFATSPQAGTMAKRGSQVAVYVA